ncbi:MAG: adenylate/guanylate cyclase domain-containing protein [Desulforegulaceae bacterium]|nr:adenylate/guanylate cyclase domain-containing protein [Desulforegulaceae bacterium]
MSRKINFQKSIPALAGIVVIISSVLVFHFYASTTNSIFKTLDFEITNLMFRIRGELPPSKQIAIIDLDEKSLKEIGQWPWSRNILAGLIEKIDSKEAKVIGLDIFFPEKDRTSPATILEKFEIKDLNKNNLPDYDQILGAQIAQSNLVMGYMFDFKKTNRNNGFPFSSASIKIDLENVKFSELNINQAKNLILNIPELSTSVTEGFINVFPESSGAVKKVPLFIMYNNLPYPSLALELYRLSKDSDSFVIKPSNQKSGSKHAILGLYSGNDFIKTDIDAQMFINFKGKPFSYNYFSASDILNDKPNINLKNKIVLIGTSAAGLLDLKATPFSGTCPGVEIHANIIDNLLNKDFMNFDKFTETAVSYMILVPLGIFTTILLLFSGPISAAIITIINICGIFLLNYFFLFKNNLIAGFSFPVSSLGTLSMAVIISNYFFREKEKKFIQTAFSHYVSPEIVNQLIKHPDKLSLSGETKTISIMFGDIRSFTTISEKLAPHELGQLLNLYFSKISEIIQSNKGVVDKFIGDAVMAFWGAPLENENHGMDSVVSAMKILKGVEILNKEWEKKNFPFIKLGIGINSGEARIGNFGSNDRFDYTAIGDNVNLASRVEGLTKFYSANILITENTNNLVKDEILTRKTDWVKVKGKTKPVEIYEPISILPFDPETEDKVKTFNLALKNYHNGNFTKAEEIIKKLKHKDSFFIYELYLERIEKLKNTPLNTWDGVFEFQTK